MGCVRVDADKIVYSAGFATEKNTFSVIQDFEVTTIPRATEKAAMRFLKENYPTGTHMVRSCTREHVSHSIHIINTTINRIQKRYPDHELIVYLTESTGVYNFRNDIATTLGYKANRKGMSRPIYYEELRRHMLSKFDCIVCNTAEADDWVIVDYEPGDVIAGVDKDLLQFPGVHYNYDKDIEKVVTVEEGNRNFFHQVMYGDEIDNIPGMRHWCKPRAWGPIKTSKLIANCVLPLEYYYAILDGYKKTLINEKFDEDVFRDRFEEQCKLLWLWRYEGDTWNWTKMVE
jgi:hypothetical protein